jgi:hypothetical protein
MTNSILRKEDHQSQQDKDFNSFNFVNKRGYLHQDVPNGNRCWL